MNQAIKSNGHVSTYASAPLTWFPTHSLLFSLKLSTDGVGFALYRAWCPFRASGLLCRRDDGGLWDGCADSTVGPIWSWQTASTSERVWTELIRLPWIPESSGGLCGLLTDVMVKMLFGVLIPWDEEEPLSSDSPDEWLPTETSEWLQRGL